MSLIKKARPEHPLLGKIIFYIFNDHHRSHILPNDYTNSRWFMGPYSKVTQRAGIHSFMCGSILKTIVVICWRHYWSYRVCMSSPRLQFYIYGNKSDFRQVMYDLNLLQPLVRQLQSRPKCWFGTAWQRYPVVYCQSISCYFLYNFSYEIGSRNSHRLANESGDSFFSLTFQH